MARSPGPGAATAPMWRCSPGWPAWRRRPRTRTRCARLPGELRGARHDRRAGHRHAARSTGPRHRVRHETQVAGHPNALRFRLLDAAGASLADELWYSIGGGFITREARRRRMRRPTAASPIRSARRPKCWRWRSAPGCSIAELQRANECARPAAPPSCARASRRRSRPPWTAASIAGLRARGRVARRAEGAPACPRAGRRHRRESAGATVPADPTRRRIMRACGRSR